MVYGMIILTLLAFVALIIIGIVYEIWGLVIAFAILLVVMLIVLWCFWTKLKIGIMLLEVAAEFITEKPSVYIAPLYPLLMGILFFAFWAVSFTAVAYAYARKIT